MSTKSDPRERQIAKIRGGHWIRYTRAQRILEQLEDLLRDPPAHRMRNLLLVGETNNGKTMLMERFANGHPPDVHLDGNSHVPVLVVQAPPVPDESRFYNAILTQLYTPFRASSRVDQRQLQVLHLLDAVGVRMLIIDEIHHVLAGTMLKQRHFLNTLKYLGNELKIPIVAVGTRDAFNAIHSDPQLANRFEPVLLPRWTLDEEYLRLLASFESVLPLRNSSGLVQDPLPAKILALSEGTIGEIAAVISAAALYAIRSGREHIDIETLDKCDYVAPSARRRMTALNA
jgi:hypothetical protein